MKYDITSQNTVHRMDNIWIQCIQREFESKLLAVLDKSKVQMENNCNNKKPGIMLDDGQDTIIEDKELVTGLQVCGFVFSIEYLVDVGICSIETNQTTYIGLSSTANRI